MPTARLAFSSIVVRVKSVRRPGGVHDERRAQLLVHVCERLHGRQMLAA